MNIYLFCNAGMSTSILVRNMSKAAAERGIDAQIEAFAIDELERRVSEADVVMLGPQVAYRLADAKKVCDAAGVPIRVIDMAVYGMCDGPRALNEALELIG